MDEQARAIVDKAYERTVNLIREKKDEVEKVALLLIEKETITHDDIIELIGPRPFKGDPAYEEFVRRRQADKEAQKDDKKSADATDEGKDDEESIKDPGLTPGLA